MLKLRVTVAVPVLEEWLELQRWRRSVMHSQLIGSTFVGKHVADAGDHIALVYGEGEEFEAVAEAVAVTHDRPHFQRIWTERERNFEGDDFAGFEFAGKRSSNAVLANFGGVSPAIFKFSVLEHADMHAGVEGEARIAADVGRCRLGRQSGREFFARCCHKSQWSVASGQ